MRVKSLTLYQGYPPRIPVSHSVITRRMALSAAGLAGWVRANGYIQWQNKLAVGVLDDALLFLAKFDYIPITRVELN